VRDKLEAHKTKGISDRLLSPEAAGSFRSASAVPYTPYSGKVLRKSALLGVCVALANSVVAENICKKLLKMDKKLI